MDESKLTADEKDAQDKVQVEDSDLDDSEYDNTEFEDVEEQDYEEVAEAEEDEAEEDEAEEDEAEEDGAEEDEAEEDLSDADQESLFEQATEPFLGRWNRLVSTTNWEKGRIILQWREALVATDASPERYADEAWGRTVGGVTGQHVGRLRRVYQRFGGIYERFEGLFWSHYHAAIDWEDAEMWLEGALRNRWSVSKMRNQRWETLGQIEAERPHEEDVVRGELDEDYETGNQVAPQADREVAEGPRHEDPDFGDAEDNTGGIEAIAGSDDPLPTVRPFEDLPTLPDDMVDAFEAMKLSILRHKGTDWVDVSQEDLLVSLDALKQLALAPSAAE